MNSVFQVSTSQTDFVIPEMLVIRGKRLVKQFLGTGRPAKGRGMRRIITKACA